MSLALCCSAVVVGFPLVLSVAGGGGDGDDHLPGMVGGIKLRFALGHLWEELNPRSCYLFADELRKCSWPGVPREVRPVTWRLLSVSSTPCKEV